MVFNVTKTGQSQWEDTFLKICITCPMVKMLQTSLKIYFKVRLLDFVALKFMQKWHRNHMLKNCIIL